MVVVSQRSTIRDRLSRGAAFGNIGSGEQDQFAEAGGYGVLP